MDEGSIQDLDNILISAEALFPMDFGDASFTSFEGGEDWVKAFTQFPQIDPIEPQPGWYVGKIHSHHTMSSFHSPTDKGDLYNTAPHLPIYLSLVVNYAMEFDCELAIAIEKRETTLTRTEVRMKGMTHFTKNIEKKVVPETENRTTFIMKCQPVWIQEGWIINQTRYLSNKPKATVGYQGAYNRSIGGPVDDSDDWHDRVYGPTHQKEKPKEQVKEATLNFTPRPGSVEFSIWNKMLENVNDLISLGTLDYYLLPALAITKLSDDLFISNKLDYQKALKLYYSKMWFNKTFKSMPGATNLIVLHSLTQFFSVHKQWITNACIIPTLDELKKEHDIIRAL